jgi:hypothetical protein
MEGSVLSFLKAEWKVSDTGSAQFMFMNFMYVNTWKCNIELVKIFRWKFIFELVQYISGHIVDFFFLLINKVLDVLSVHVYPSTIDSSGGISTNSAFRCMFGNIALVDIIQSEESTS